MSKSTCGNLITRKKVRAAETGTMIGVRLQRKPLAMVDAWIKAQAEPLTRPEAIRQLVEIALAAGKGDAPKAKASKPE